MSWVSQNKFLAGFLVVVALGLGGAGYYLATRYSAYVESMKKFDLKRSQLVALRKKELYPNKENVVRIEESVKAYKEKVTDLQAALLKFQKPLDTEIQDTAFGQNMKSRVANFQEVAAAGEMELPPDFYMGFLEYRNEVPRPSAVGLLDYQEKAIEKLLLTAVGAGVEQLLAFNREPLPIEADGYTAPKNPAALEKYPVELTLSGTHEAIRRFFNEISNDTEYFYIIRFLRIENSAKEGPARGEIDDSLFPQGTGPGPGPGLDEFGFEDAVEGEAEKEEQSLHYDAKIVMGQEQIQAFVMIDVVRFVEIK